MEKCYFAVLCYLSVSEDVNETHFSLWGQEEDKKGEKEEKERKRERKRRIKRQKKERDTEDERERK